MQNKILRFINGFDHRKRVDYHVFSTTGFLNVDLRVQQMRLNHAHRIFYNKCPRYMNSNFVKMVDIHTYNTRSSEFNFYTASVNCHSSNTFYYNAINSLE